MSGMLIDGIAASQHIDSSGEVLDLTGHDISDLENGKGCINWEHAPAEEGPENILGQIVYAKKIFKITDCDDERQAAYWEKCQKPFLYIKAELFDDDMHPGAIAAAALIRYYARRNEPLLAGFSIEGSTLERDGNVLKRSVGRRLALTMRPCNRTCVAGLLDDPQLHELYQKSEQSPDGKNLFQVDTIILRDGQMEVDPLLDALEAVRELKKTLTAGGGNAAPSALVGGAALTREEFAKKVPKEHLTRMKAKFRDWPRTRPLKEWMKHELPDVSPDYVEHFADIAHDVSLRKGFKPLARISRHHSTNRAPTPQQSALIEGLHMDPDKTFKRPEEDMNVHAKPLLHLKNDAEHEVLVKPPRGKYETQGEMFDPAHHATVYADLASGPLGMGEHVPVTNHFVPPGEREAYSAVQYMPGSKSLMHESTSPAYAEARKNGDLHKLHLMDVMLGASQDRHPGNIIVTPNGKLMHIDNDNSFMHDAPQHSFNIDPSVNPMSIDAEFVHPEARKWLRSVNSAKIAGRMRQLGMSPLKIDATLRAIRHVKEGASSNKTMAQIQHDVMADHLPKAYGESND